MSKDEAHALHEALHDIETGQVDKGARLLRTLLSLCGHPAPLPPAVERRERQREEQER